MSLADRGSSVYYIEVLYIEPQYIKTIPFRAHAADTTPSTRIMTARPSIELQTLTRRCNEGLILTSLERGAKHGYQLALDLEERGGSRFALKHGTLYPILHDLEKRGLIEGDWSDEGPRGKRKSYRLTPSGRAYAEELRNGWRVFMRELQQLLSSEEP